MRHLFLILLLGFPLTHAETVLSTSNSIQRDSVRYISDEGLSAVDHRGKLLWTVLTDRQLFEPVIVDSQILIGSTDGLFALDRQNGEILWRQGKGKTWFSPLVVTPNVYAGSLDDGIIALDLISGQHLWKNRLEGWVYSPALVDGMIIAGGSDHKLWALNPVDGAILWKRPLSQEVVYRPVRLNNSVLVATFDGTITRIDTDGNTLWRSYQETPTLRMTAQSTRFFSLGMGGHLRAHDSRTGAVLAHRHILIDSSTGLDARGESLYVFDGSSVRQSFRAADLSPIEIPATGAFLHSQADTSKSKTY